MAACRWPPPRDGQRAATPSLSGTDGESITAESADIGNTNSQNRCRERKDAVVDGVIELDEAVLLDPVFSGRVGGRVKSAGEAASSWCQSHLAPNRLATTVPFYLLFLDIPERHVS